MNAQFGAGEKSGGEIRGAMGPNGHKKPAAPEGHAPFVPDNPQWLGSNPIAPTTDFCGGQHGHHRGGEGLLQGDQPFA